MSAEQSIVIYKDIPGFPGYRAGDDGSVWSCRVSAGVPGVRGSVPRTTDTWHRLQPRVGRKGYLHVTLRCNSRSYGRWVHRLVLEAFIGPRPDGMECRHFPDRNPGNNRLGNLAWGTREQNEQDKANDRLHGRTQPICRNAKGQISAHGGEPHSS